MTSHDLGARKSQSTHQPAAPNHDDGGKGEGEDHLRLGWAKYGAGEYKQAVDTFDAGLERFPGDVELLYGLGMALKKAEKKRRALGAFEAALERMAAVTDETRRKMLARFARQQIHHIVHGRWRRSSTTGD